MSNLTFISEVPPAPVFKLHPAPLLITDIHDLYLSLALPVIAYWGWGLMFFYFDTHNCFERSRLHTPAEIRKRNLVPIPDVVRCVLIQQSWQIALGILFYAGPTMIGREDYDIAVWARRIRMVQRYIPTALRTIGLDSRDSAHRLAPLFPTFAAFMNGGGQYIRTPIDFGGSQTVEPAFLGWEILFAKAIYYVLVPVLQFSVAIFVGDTWQYLLHRLSHQIGWVYNNLHSVHHRVYCPYAFGAFYANLAEAFIWDVGGTGLALWLSQLTVRQAMWFTTLSVMKSVDDHCGYRLRWDPFQWINGQNAAYHDVHHQSWGMKTNFAQVYTIFWDRVLGTQWTGDDVAERYQRGKLAAQRAVEREEKAALRRKL